MERSASCDGAQVPFCFCRHSSFREARMDTTTLRLSGFSGCAMSWPVPSAYWDSLCATLSAISRGEAAPAAAVFAASWRTDILLSGRTCAVCLRC